MGHRHSLADARTPAARCNASSLRIRAMAKTTPMKECSAPLAADCIWSTEKSGKVLGSDDDWG